MGLLSVKDYLSYEELAEYLNNYGENFNIYNDYDDERLKKIIIDLIYENKIRAVIYYAGSGHFEKIFSDGKVKKYPSDYLAGFFCLHSIQLHRLIKVNSLAVSNGSFLPYKLEDINRIDSFLGEKVYDNSHLMTILYDMDLGKKPILTLNSIRFIKSDLDKLFNQPTDHTTQLQAEIDRLTDENQQQADTIRQLNERLASQPDTPAEPISEPLKGIARVNYDSGKAQQFARIVAKFLWDMDTSKRIRTGTMANQIYALVHEFDSNTTPQTADTVKEWIKSIAPEYAKKGGNEPKEQPPIILTLKN